MIIMSCAFFSSYFLSKNPNSSLQTWGFDKAFFKSELAADNPLPLDQGSTVFISVCDEDKGGIWEVTRKLKEAGLSIVGTEGTAEYLRGRGIVAKKLKVKRKIILVKTV
jgi:carbamoyl-phosphate synthase large subunit